MNNDLHSGSILSNVLPRDVRILQMPRNIGYAGGANAALADWLGRATDDEVCVLGSHDMHVAPEALRRLMREAAAHTDYGVLSPAQISPVANSGGMWTGKAALLAPEVPSCEGILERDWASGTCLVVRAACARQTGGFDASLHSYMEDVDFCLRAKDAGWRVGVVPSAIAWGLGSASDDAMSMIEANTVRLVARRSGVVAGVCAMGTLATWTVRACAGSWAPWRSRTRRDDSMRFVRRHWRAWRLLWGPRAEPRRILEFGRLADRGRSEA